MGGRNNENSTYCNRTLYIRGNILRSNSFCNIKKLQKEIIRMKLNIRI